MLNNRTLVQVLPLAQKLVAAGKTVTALENTPLALINDCASVHSLFVDGKTIDDYSHEQIFETLVNSTRSTGEDGINEHAALRQTVVTNAARAVNQAMSMARNMVVPDINRVLKTVQELTDGFVSTLLEPFVVVSEEQSPLFTDPLLLELVERFSETPARAVVARSLPAIDVETVKTKIATGSQSFDDAVLAFLGDAGLMAVAEAFSGNMHLDNLRPEFHLGLHLLAKAMVDDPLDGTPMGLTDYNFYLSQIVEQTGRTVLQVIEQTMRRRKLGLLYTSPTVANQGFREIRVDNAVYVKMLKEGLSPEALFGNELLGRRYMATQLLEHKEELELTYAREMRLRQARHGVEAAQRTRDYVVSAITLMINEREEDMLPAPRSELHVRLHKFFSGMVERDFAPENLAVICRNAVTHVFYAHTPARRILEIIDSVGKQNPDIDPREAALIAAAKYVSQWVAALMKVN